MVFHRGFNIHSKGREFRIQIFLVLWASHLTHKQRILGNDQLLFFCTQSTPSQSFSSALISAALGRFSGYLPTSAQCYKPRET